MEATKIQLWKKSQEAMANNKFKYDEGVTKLAPSSYFYMQYMKGN